MAVLNDPSEAEAFASLVADELEPEMVLGLDADDTLDIKIELIVRSAGQGAPDREMMGWYLDLESDGKSAVINAVERVRDELVHIMSRELKYNIAEFLNWAIAQIPREERVAL